MVEGVHHEGSRVVIEQRDRAVADQPIAALDAVTHQGAMASLHTRVSIPLGARAFSQVREVDDVAIVFVAVLNHAQVVPENGERKRRNGGM